METQWQPHIDNEPSDQPPSPTNIAALLRNLGALLVIGSGFIYLLQGVGDAEGLVRDWVYLGLIGAFITGGLFSQRLMNDTKGARLFFGLGLVAVPVQFAQVGSLIINGSDAILYTTLLGALSVLLSIGTSALAFAILHRPQAKLFSVIFIVGNLSLLMPTREMGSALLISGGMGIAIYVFVSRLPLVGIESKLAVLSLFSPLVILIARAAFNHGDHLGYGFVYLQLAVVLSSITRHLGTHTLREVLNALSLLMFFISLCTIGFACPKAWISDEITLTVLCGVSTALFAVYISHQTKHPKPYRIFALVAMTITCLLMSSGSHGIDMAILLVAAFLMIGSGILCESKALTIGTTIIVTMYLIFEGGNHLLQTTTHAWVLLAIAGVACVGVSSVAEKAKQGDISLLNNLKTCWSDWEF